LRIDFHGNKLLYPLQVLRSKLLLSGISRLKSEEIIVKILKELAFDNQAPAPNEFEVNRLAMSYIGNRDARDKFKTVLKYEARRCSKDPVAPIVVAISGASATGKSMIALELVGVLAATRYISTDTIRQLLRSTFSKEQYPELFCHTYQVHEVMSEIPSRQSKFVAGYFAQTSIMEPTIRKMVTRLIDEGATSLIEGVHLIPGSLKDISPTLIEVIINPSSHTHELMFASKEELAKLRTVSGEEGVREEEFVAAREIQSYLLDRAEASDTTVIPLASYEQAIMTIGELVVERMKTLL
jgi:2-phosphoglycerate kinase